MLFTVPLNRGARFTMLVQLRSGASSTLVAQLRRQLISPAPVSTGRAGNESPAGGQDDAGRPTPADSTANGTWIDLSEPIPDERPGPHVASQAETPPSSAEVVRRAD
jgi:hypothetical protein